MTSVTSPVKGAPVVFKPKQKELLKQIEHAKKNIKNWPEYLRKNAYMATASFPK